MKIYTYKSCDACRKATKWLKAREIEFEEIAIRETPPSVAELEEMLEDKEQLKLLFNTSGRDYRSLGMKDKLPTMTDSDALELLHSNGNLIKRPFVISDDVKLLGFKEPVWDAAFG